MVGRSAPHRRFLVAAAALLALALCGSAFSAAGYQAASANRGTQLAAAADWVPPLVSLSDPGPAVHGVVQLSASASDPYGSGVASVKVEREVAGSGSWTAVCTDTAAPYSCSLDTAGLADEYFDFRAVAADNAGFTAASQVNDVMVDNRAPSIGMVDPGSRLSGVVTLSAEATDADSGVAAVTIQLSPAGKGSWTAVCTDATAPYSCRLDTTALAEGSYDLRALATDIAGNSATSGTVQNRRVDNTVSSVSLEDPGPYLRGTVLLSANASSTAGVALVTIQRSPAGKATWSDICRLGSAPYSCSWNTTDVADGSFDLRAVLVTATGTVLNSATIAARQVDNTPVRGLDVQAGNHSGGIVGRLETGDALTFTYSEQMNLGSIDPGWSGASPTSIYLRLRDGNLLGTGPAGDTIQFSTDSSGSNQLRLGSLNTRADLVKNNKTSVFNAALTATTATVGGIGQTVVTVTVGSLVSGGALRTSGISTQMLWTPSSSATDLSGNPCSTAPVYEGGALDVDF